MADWPLAIRASRTVIATVEERVAGPLQEEADWRLIPAIHLSALVHCPGGAAPTGYPGYYDLDEGQIALYLKSAKDPAAWADYLQKYVFQRKLNHQGTRGHRDQENRRCGCDSPHTFLYLGDLWCLLVSLWLIILSAPAAPFTPPFRRRTTARSGK